MNIIVIYLLFVIIIIIIVIINVIFIAQKDQVIQNAHKLIKYGV